MPTILDILDKLTGGINEALEIKVFNDKSNKNNKDVKNVTTNKNKI